MKKKKEEETTGQKYNGLPIPQGDHKNDFDFKLIKLNVAVKKFVLVIVSAQQIILY